MRLSMTAAAMALCLSSGAAFAGTSPSNCDSNAQNQVQNCGFETGDFTNWAVTGSTNALAQTWAYGVDTLNPGTGAHEAYFGTEGATPGTVTANDQLMLTQSIALTESLTYQLSFYIEQDTPVYKGYANYFNATFDGTSVLTLTNSAVIGTYTLETFTVTGSASGANSLTFSSQNDAGTWSLDDISLIELPEPASVAVFGLGLAGLAAAAHRRRRAV